jgi:hypothetical protein
MLLDDALISERTTYLANQIYEKLDIISPWYPIFADYIVDKRFWVELQLADGASIMLREKYNIIEHKLKISQYCYIYYDSTGKEIFRADNSEHHDVSTNPHHIHDFRFRKRGQVKPFLRQDIDNPDITEFFAHIHGERR